MTNEQLETLQAAVHAAAPDVRIISGYGGAGYTALLKLQVGTITSTRSIADPVADVAELVAQMRAEIAPKRRAAATVRRLVDDAY